jgi:phospholipid transport system substrate-binding protein
MTLQQPILVLVLALPLVLSRPGLIDDSRTGDTGLTAGQRTPLDAVRSSYSRVLVAVHSRPPGVSSAEGGRAEIRRAVHDLFDLRGMARRTLGQHWKGLSPSEQDDFVRLFTDVLLRSFVTIVERHSGDEVAFLRDEDAGTHARVHSRVVLEQGPATSIEYRLVKIDSRWAVYDIVFDGMSLVSSYRSQFNSIIGTSLFARLLERMRTEPASGPDSRAGGARSPAPGLDPAVRERLTGLVLGAASSSRR